MERNGSPGKIADAEGRAVPWEGGKQSDGRVVENSALRRETGQRGTAGPRSLHVKSQGSANNPLLWFAKIPSVQKSSVPLWLNGR